MRPGATRFTTNYISLDNLLKKRVYLKILFISNEWTSHKLSQIKVGHEVERLMFDHEYWEKVEKLVSIYKALCTVLCIYAQCFALLNQKSSQPCHLSMS